MLGGLGFRAQLRALAGYAGAALVGFQQTGAGARVQTVDGVLKLIAVRATDFENTDASRVVADGGTTDNVSGIQRAVDAVNLAGGGVVMMPKASTYYGVGSAVEHKSKVWLAGEGSSGASEIRSTAAGDSTIISIGDISNWGVVGLKLRGNRSAAASGHGIEFTHTASIGLSQGLLRDLFIEEVKEDGIHQVTGLAISAIVAENLNIGRCGGYGWNTEFLNDSKLSNIDIRYGETGGFRCIGSNIVSANLKVWGCRVANLGTFAHNLVTPAAATQALDQGAVIVAGSNHQFNGLEIQENGSIGLQVGTTTYSCQGSSFTNVVIDGNGGYDPAQPALTQADYRRDGILLINYYDVRIQGVCDDFRARVNQGRQLRGIKSVGTVPPFTAGSLQRGDWYKITNNGGGADFTNVQLGLAATSNAVGTIFQARAINFGTPTPTSWGTGQLSAVNDRLSIDLRILNQYEQDQATGAGYDFASDGGNSTFLINGAFVPVVKTANLTVEGTTAAGTCVYVSQQIRYFKQHGRCFFHGLISYNTHTGTGNIKLTGLPETADGGVGNAHPIIVVPVACAFTEQIGGYVQGSTIFLRLFAAAGTNAGVPIGATQSFYIKGDYEID